MSVNRAFENDRFKEILERTARNHPFLRAVIAHDETDNSYYYDVTDSSRIELVIHDDILTDIDASALMQEYERLTGYDWDISKEGLLKASVWRMKEKTAVLLVFHHLLADGRGAMNLAEEIAEAYTKNADRGTAAEKLISSADDLPKDSKLPFISRMLVRISLEGDCEIRFEPELPVRVMRASPLVRADAGKVCLMRGPVVYCLEEADNGKNLQTLFLPKDARFTVKDLPGTLGGITALEGSVLRLDPEAWDPEELYSDREPSYSPAEARWIPYYAWANRGEGEMTVWMHAL